MKRDTALKIAAAETGASLEDTQALTEAFLRALRQCPVCDGSGRFTYRGRVDVPIKEHGSPEWVAVDVGENGVCPLCAGSKGDPDWVIWHCREGGYMCHPDASERPKGHENCGWIVTIPWE